MSEIFATSDTHFCHDKEFLWKNRGFASIDDMNEAIIRRWNRTVNKNDIVYHLGDIMLIDDKKGLECFKRLNGRIVFIIGNHDTDTRIRLLFNECKEKIEGGVLAYRFKHNKTSFYASHFPTITANFDDKKFSQHIIGIHGHTHNRTHWINPANPFMYDVGMDSNNFTPIALDDIVIDIRRKWENMNT